MDSYTAYKTAKNSFYEHYYQDIKQFLSDKQNISYSEYLSYFKKKYTFYNFDKDEDHLLYMIEHYIKNKIIQYLKRIIKDNNKIDKTILRNSIFNHFPMFCKNIHIFTPSILFEIDKIILDTHGNHLYHHYNQLYDLKEYNTIQINNFNYIIGFIGIFTVHFQTLY